MKLAHTAASRAYEAFNARFLSAEDIASTFIPPPQYEKLLGQRHTVLFGPRGSGKTTLLKMLQLRSLAVWQHPEASDVRKSLPFHAIFLGTDVLWGSQLDSRTNKIRDREKAGQVRRSSFRLHLAIALLDAIDECRDPVVVQNNELKRFAVDFDRETESELAGSLSSIWKITTSPRTLLGVRVAIQTQLADLLIYVNRLRSDDTTPLPDFAYLEPVPSILSALDLTNRIFRQPDRRWAVLCDELEIAPEMIRAELFQLLRSSNQKVLFKFSFFPYSSDVELSALASPQSPTANNDYEPLDLTYGKREGAYEFCKALLKGMVEDAGGQLDVGPEELLGDGWFDGGRSHRRVRGSPYAPPEGEFYRRAIRLFKNDRSFRAWLTQMKIDLARVHEMESSDQAPFRKALPFILTRSEYLRPDGSHRSRKAYSSSLYTGTYSMFSITEGNPRIFINLMRPLVRQFIDHGGSVGSDIQAASAGMTIHRFRSSLSAIPSNRVGTIRSILHLIDIVGMYFQNAQLNETFRAEPPSTFIVDNDLSPELVELVGRAMNSGAFVRMDDSQDAGITDLRGNRLRLAYTLAPEFKLPLVSGRTINLSSILQARDAASRRNPETVKQSRLPFGIDG